MDYLSPTSLSLFYKDREEFYLHYLAKNKAPRLPQNKPMSIGSAFDAFIKAYLSEKLFNEIREGFDLTEIFENQVEEHNRDWAWENGNYVYNCYRQSGACDDLLKELEQAKEEPRFEFTLNETIDGIPLLGKPDLYFRTKDDGKVVYDWKINGYCAKNSVSPKRGYVMLRDGWEHNLLKASRNHGKAHKDAHIFKLNGIEINAGLFLEDLDENWARQNFLYALLLGVGLGEEYIAGIDQGVAKPIQGKKPLMRFARHRCRVGKTFQLETWAKVKEAWSIIKSGIIFPDLGEEGSKNEQDVLDQVYATGSVEEQLWFRQNMR